MPNEEELQAETPEYSATEEMNDISSDSVSTNNNQAPPDLFWISEGQDIVISTIYVYKEPTTGRLRTILTEPSQGLKESGMIEFPVETRWSVPSKAQLDSYRERSAKFNHVARAVLVNRGILEDLIARNHLLELKIGSGDHQKNLELIRDKKGTLTNESMKMFNQLHPSVIDLIFGKFIDEAALII